MTTRNLQTERDTLLLYMTRRFGDSTGRTFTGRDARDLKQFREQANALTLAANRQRREASAYGLSSEVIDAP